jgi:hypothetical protein
VSFVSDLGRERVVGEFFNSLTPSRHFGVVVLSKQQAQVRTLRPKCIADSTTSNSERTSLWVGKNQIGRREKPGAFAKL